MSDLRELYQEVIIDHGRKPRHFHVLPNASHTAEGFNPLCGDKLTLYLFLEEDVIKEASFVGAGCAISTASASLMTDYLQGKTTAEAKALFQDFHQLIMNKDVSPAMVAKVGKLAVLGGVREFPSRVKCATLAWHALCTALENK